MNETKVSQQINDVVGDNVKKLAQLFPSAVKDGEVDFEALKEELGSFTEVGAEKYELTWAGKADAKRIAREDIIGKTLKYIPEDSKDADTTENLYIEGDNLEVLKLLRQNYYGAIKMIYIDPPYNTGNDFVYNDSFDMTQMESDVIEGNVNELGERYQLNQKSSNRFHAKWMNMIYPRLKIAKDLLTDDGIIIISIDDCEHKDLKLICDEIFGEQNFIDNIIWKKRYGGGAKERYLVSLQEYALMYAKCIDNIDEIFVPLSLESAERYYTKKDEKYATRGGYRTHPLEAGKAMDARPNLIYPIQAPDGTDIWPKKQWLWSKERVTEALAKGDLEIVKGKSGDWVVSSKQYLYDEEGNMRPGKFFSIIENVYTQHGTNEMINIMGDAKIFQYPKPSELIRQLLLLGTNKNSLVMDFFSGSGATAHAVMQLNAEDGGNRKYILVQLPEECAEDSVAYKNGYMNICQIGRERIKRSAELVKSTAKNSFDAGFKVFRVADTNIKWNSLMDMGQLDVSQIESTPDLMDFMPNTKDIDVVYELMLRQRDVALSEAVELLSDIGNRTYLYASSFLVCLETEVTESLVEKIAAIDPLPIKFIFRDSAFKDDIALKDETFRRLKALVEKNSGESKPTYTVEFI